MRRSVTVVGAGLGGSLAALFLARQGHEVAIHERRSDPRLGPAQRGRSINLAISTRGLAALDAIGLGDAVRAMAVPMRGRMIHPVEGPLAFQPYGSEEHNVLHSVSRA